MTLAPLHKHLLNDYQQDFPLSPTPFLDIALQLGATEDEVLAAFQVLAEQRMLSRIGPVIAPNSIGSSALVAMAVPEHDVERVAELVSAYPQVNHNYQRENRFNLWFVLVADQAAQRDALIADIEARTGHPAMVLPMLADYFINLGFELNLND